MTALRERMLLAGAVLACLSWAAVEARHVKVEGGRPDPCALRPADPSAVGASYRELGERVERGEHDEALLALRDRTARGPFPGYAWFLLGEVAYEEGQFREAVRHYRKAVETDPTVADRRGAMDSARRIRERTSALRGGPWSADPPDEIRDLYFLQRRLAGGCE